MNATLAASIDQDFTPGASPSAARPAARSRKALWAGRILSGLSVLFLTLDTVMKLAGVKAAVEGTVQLGYPPSSLLVIGLIEIVCLALFLIPRTAIVGAVLWTGYFGGAIATHLRLGHPLFSHTLFPIYVAAMIWGGLYLRDRRVAGLLSR